VDVRTRVEWLADALFRRHVIRSADHRSGRTSARIGQQFRQTKIHDAHTLKLKIVIRSDDEYVFRFEIAMHDTLAMRGAHARADSAHQPHRAFHGEAVFTL